VKRTEIEFPEKHAALRDDVHMLGELVGEVLRDQGGEALFDLVERDRCLAIARRNGDADAAAALEVRTRDREPSVARDLERAFSSWFQAVNLAEQLHRVRRRRAYFLAEADKPQPGGIDEAVARIKAAGLPWSELRALIAGLHIEPVFIAHPIESTRRTILRKQLRLAGFLFDRLDPTLSPGERRVLRERIRTELTTSWQTEDHPRERLTVADEREHVLFYLVEVLYRIVPNFYEELSEAIGKHYGEAAARFEIPTMIRFGTWVGGDMDGSPDVNAKTLRGTLARQQQAIVNAYFGECQSLAQLLSQSGNRVGVSSALQQRIDEYELLTPAAKAGAPARHDRMPYRVFLGQVAERLRATYDLRPNGYETSLQFRRDIELVATSLEAHRGSHAGLHQVRRLLRRIDTFGFHLATLDVRQHTSIHHAVIARGLDDAEWSTLDSKTRHQRLVSMLQRDVGPRVEFDANGRRCIGVFDAMLQCRRRYGAAAVGSYVVNGVMGTDDVLAALLLAQWAEAYDKKHATIAIDIAPMFDSMEALDRAGDILRDLLAEPIYRRHLDAHSRRQTALVGYAESAKQAGIVAARLAAYHAQGALASAIAAAGEQHVLVHARGGSIARGGGRVDTIVTGMPPSTVNGWLRLTEQGESLNRHYGLGPIALRTFERAFGALSLATAAVRTGEAADPAPELLALAARLSADSSAAYRAFVDDTPAFEAWFRAVTPIDVIERMQIGARPIVRPGMSGFAGLRSVPWVFAWTQNRMLLPGWFGAGSGLRAAIDGFGGETVRRALRDWPFLRQIVDDVEMMLAYADLEIAAFYAGLAEDAPTDAFRRVTEEHALAVAAVLEIKQIGELLDGDRTQQRALALRNPYVDPMNLMQVDLLRRWRASGRQDRELFEALLASINGIAQGLQTTG
jgi:phosphoenolpyruvate carboxylase